MRVIKNQKKMRVTADWPHRSLRRGIVMDALVQDFNTALDETGAAVVVGVVVVVVMVAFFFLGYCCWFS